MAPPYDSIIIGAGLAGLAAAAQLSRRGRTALVLERNSEIGGRARTDDVDGWLFNHGGHALYRGGVGLETLRQLGVEPSGAVASTEGAQAVLDGSATTLPVDAKGLVRTRALSAPGKFQFAKLMAGLGRLDAGAFANVTVDDWLSGYRRDVQAIVKALVRLTTYAAATELMSADAAISQLQYSEAGVLYLHGGWGRLCDQIAASAASGPAASGAATIVTGTSVARVAQVAGRFRVTTGDGEHDATTVIVAAGGPGVTARLLGLDADTFGPVGPAPEAAVLDLALPEMPSHHRFALGIDELTYFSVHSPPARLAPTGAVAAVAMRYLHPDDDASAATHRASLEETASLAGSADPVRSRFLRRMTVAQAMPIASAGGLAGRPGVEVPGMSGAFVAGDWIGAHGLLADAAIATGFNAATLV